MPNDDVDGIGLADAIAQIKAELASAKDLPDIGVIYLPVKSVTVELKVVATKSAGAKAGFKVPFVELELGGSGELSRERTHTITVVFDTPVDQLGDPLQVENMDDIPGV